MPPDLSAFEEVLLQTGDDEIADLWGALVVKAARYAQAYKRHVGFMTTDRESAVEKARLNDLRSQAHEALISSYQSFLRNWKAKRGDYPKIAAIYDAKDRVAVRQLALDLETMKRTEPGATFECKDPFE